MKIIFEIGMQQQQQQFDNKGDKVNTSKKSLTNPIESYIDPSLSFRQKSALSPSPYSPGIKQGRDLLAEVGNEAANILGATYKQFVKNGELTKEEIAKLERIDDILSAADIVVNPKNGNATIVQDDGTTFDLKLPEGGGKKGGKGR